MTTVRNRSGKQSRRRSVRVPQEPRRLNIKVLALAIASVITAGLVVLTLTAPAQSPAVMAEAAKKPSAAAERGTIQGASDSSLGPLGTALQQDIAAAVKATAWPTLIPPMEEAIAVPSAPPELIACGDVGSHDQNCVWGSPSAPFRIVVVGDSIAVAYGEPLRRIAEESGGRIQVHTVALSGCPFSADDIVEADPERAAACPGVKERALGVINTTKPDVVMIANSYSEKRRVDSDQNLTSAEWANGIQRIVDKFRANTRTVVWLSPPPADQNIASCYTKPGSTPADCLSKVTDQWLDAAQAEQDVARGSSGVWIDSRPWFCSDGGCPAFVGSTPTKRDTEHPTQAYGDKITPVVAESLRAAGVLGPTG